MIVQCYLFMKKIQIIRGLMKLKSRFHKIRKLPMKKIGRKRLKRLQVVVPIVKMNALKTLKEEAKTQKQHH